MDKNNTQATLKKVKIRPGDRYRHFKGGEYEIVTLAIKEDTLEPLVVYKSLRYGYIWARTYKNWSETVSVKGKQVKRFKKIK
jgi:hypothetical protein